MSNINSKTAWFALVVGHTAGMIDLAALPVWVGTLISGYGFSPAQSGGLATLFLAGVVMISLVLSPLFHRLSARVLVPLGFWISTAAFGVMISTVEFGMFANLHAIAGLGTGLAISFTHGTMGKTESAHKVFGLGGLGLGVMAILFLGATPPLIEANGRETLFIAFALIMGFAAILTTLLFPSVGKTEATKVEVKKFDKQVWLLIFGVMCMALNSALILSFAERIGMDSGFGFDRVQLALVVMSVIALVAALTAVVLQKRLPPLKTAIIGSIFYGALAFTIMAVPGYPAFFIPLILYPSAMLLTHTFTFGHLAKIEPTGRAVAATPAMNMTGSMIAPLLGGSSCKLRDMPRSGSPRLQLP